jgi:hypothetical protein
MINLRRISWAGHAESMGKMRNAYEILVGKSERKRPLGRPRRRWEDNIKEDLREIVLDSVDWVHLAYDKALVNMVMNLRVP